MATLLQRMIGAKWFTRVWVLQELVLSKEPWIQVGRHKIAWEDFMQSQISFEHVYHLNNLPSLWIDMARARSE